MSPVTAHPFAARTNIKPEEILTLPYGSFSGKITLVQKPSEVTKAVNQISAQPILGFDTETRPSFKKGQYFKVAMLQLATAEQAWLFRLHHTGFPPELQELLTDHSTLKCGVAIRDDLKALQKISSFEPGGFVELASLSKQKGLEVEGLRKLAAILLGIRISKSAQTTNWESKVLTGKQIEYAATDAWACLEIYRKLQERP